MATSVTYVAVPESVAVARHEISDRVRESAARPTVALAVSELMTYALTEGALGAADTITVHLESVPRGVRITVCDTGALADAELRHDGATEVHRHGRPVGGLSLKIVARLASRWGLVSDRPGGRAWFEVDAHLTG